MVIAVHRGMSRPERVAETCGDTWCSRSAWRYAVHRGIPRPERVAETCGDTWCSRSVWRYAVHRGIPRSERAPRRMSIRGATAAHGDTPCARGIPRRSVWPRRVAIRGTTAAYGLRAVSRCATAAYGATPCAEHTETERVAETCGDTWHNRSVWPQGREPVRNRSVWRYAVRRAYRDGACGRDVWRYVVQPQRMAIRGAVAAYGLRAVGRRATAAHGDTSCPEACRDQSVWPRPVVIRGAVAARDRYAAEWCRVAVAVPRVSCRCRCRLWCDGSVVWPCGSVRGAVSPAYGWVAGAPKVRVW